MRYYFFLEDISALEEMIQELHEKIKELGKEQGIVAKQSTENFGHDDACQEAVDQGRRVVVGRIDYLREVINNTVVVNPEPHHDEVRMGATVELSDGRILRIGSFMVLANHPIVNISYGSPLARALFQKQEGDEVEFRGSSFMIERIS